MSVQCKNKVSENYENIFTQVKEYMRSKFYLFNETWLRECVQYCTDSHSKLSVQGIQSFAEEQWLLSNLREMNNENGSLPKKLFEQKCTTLHGRYILQVEKMYDISTSKYKQLSKIRNVDNENLKSTKDLESNSWEPKGKRMYQLFLTDGLQEVQAIEYKPISFLNETLLPGYKLMIIGPVTCRRGLIMLEETHISGIGGEVEDLLISNSIENVLARCLNMKENPDPYNDITNRKEESPNCNSDEEFEKNLSNLENLLQNKKTKENGKPSSNLNSSVSTLPSNSTNINLQKASPEQNVDELFTDDELQALLNDPDIVDEFPPVKSTPNRVNLEKLGQKISFKVPSLPSSENKSETNQKRKFISENSNVISRPDKKLKFQNNSFPSDSKNKKLSGLWDNLNEIKSDYSEKVLKTSSTVEMSNKVPKSGASAISKFQDDDLILDDKDLIVFDSWDNPKIKTSNFCKPPIEEPSVVQLLKLPNNDLEIEKYLVRKGIDSKRSSTTSQSYKPLFSKSCCNTDLEIKKLSNDSKSWKIISNEVPTAKLELLEKPKSIIIDADFESKKSSKPNILELKNSFGISKPYKPLFPTEEKSLSQEKLMNDNLIMETSKIEDELKLRLKKLLNKPTKNIQENSNNTGELISKIKNQKKSEKITIGRKRPMSPVSSSPTEFNIYCKPDSVKETINRNEELPPKICEFICDLNKESPTEKVIHKTIRGKVKKKGQLSHKNNRWNLDGLISDGTANLEVEFSSEFMDSVMGYTASEFLLSRKKARKDSKLMEQLSTVMKNAQYKLEHSDWLMQVELARNRKPIVITGTESTEEQRKVFEKRLQMLKPTYA